MLYESTKHGSSTTSAAFVLKIKPNLWGKSYIFIIKQIKKPQLCFVLRREHSRSREKHSPIGSCFPLHLFRARAASCVLYTEQSIVEAFLFVNYWFTFWKPLAPRAVQLCSGHIAHLAYRAQNNDSILLSIGRSFNLREVHVAIPKGLASHTHLPSLLKKCSKATKLW